MKKVLAILLALVMILSFAACGKKEEEAKEEEEKKTTIIYFCKNLGDLSLNDSGWQGTKAAADKYGWEASYVECGSDVATFKNAFLDALGKYDIVVTQNGFGMGDLCLEYAPQYPDMKFICFDMGKTTDLTGIDNLFGAFFKQNEASYLGGALAAKLTKSNKIGCFLMGDVPALNDFGTGFIAGARAANENVEISVAYGGGIATADKLKEISSAMYDSGIDVIFGGSSSCFPGLAKETYERGGFASGLYAIGVDADQWKTYSASENKQLADVIISSICKNAGAIVEYACDHYVAGDLEWGKLMAVGVAEGGSELADNEYYRAQVPEEILTYIDDLKAKIISGEIEVPSYYDFEDYDAYVTWRDANAKLDANSISGG